MIQTKKQLFLLTLVLSLTLTVSGLTPFRQLTPRMRVMQAGVDESDTVDPPLDIASRGDDQPVGSGEIDNGNPDLGGSLGDGGSLGGSIGDVASGDIQIVDEKETIPAPTGGEVGDSSNFGFPNQRIQLFADCENCELQSDDDGSGEVEDDEDPDVEDSESSQDDASGDVVPL